MSSSTTDPEVRPKEEVKEDTGTEQAAVQLPPLSAQELRIWNSLAERMDRFHNHFRSDWTSLKAFVAPEPGQKKSPLRLPQFLSLAASFTSTLTLHHNFEEALLFPILEKKMPMFRNKKEMKFQHKFIHAGLEAMQKYLEEVRKNERDFRREECWEIMSSFETVMWEHLDEEVKNLGADSMRRYWTKKEMVELSGKFGG